MTKLGEAVEKDEAGWVAAGINAMPRQMVTGSIRCLGLSVPCSSADICWLATCLRRRLRPVSRLSHRQPDLLKAAFGAALALAWAVFGAWLAMRRARRPDLLDETADDTTPYRAHASHNTWRAPTCERMYDETRLVPHYPRSVEFPSTKHELVRLAKGHTDEGQALRRLECIPDRRYGSLHDLIIEIRCD